jgi:hypothetical protein
MFMSKNNTISSCSTLDCCNEDREYSHLILREEINEGCGAMVERTTF